MIQKRRKQFLSNIAIVEYDYFKDSVLLPKLGTK